ncbi:MAG: hypothetical protein ABFD82_07895 [Syntrophaceae bacterium]
MYSVVGVRINALMEVTERKGSSVIMIVDQFPMLNVLHSEKPAPDKATKMMLYGQFVGPWEGYVVVHASE